MAWAAGWASSGRAKRSGALPDRDKALKERVGGGYCEGIALDWLRRVVQGGRPSYTPSPHSGSEVADALT